MTPISAIVPSYLGLGFTKRQAVHFITESRLGAKDSRHASINTPEWEAAMANLNQVGDDIKALVARIERNRRRRYADVQSEEVSEGRTVAHHYRQAIHE